MMEFLDDFGPAPTAEQIAAMRRIMAEMKDNSALAMTPVWQGPYQRDWYKDYIQPSSAGS